MPVACLRNPRFTFVRGDIGSSEDLQRLAGSAAGFDVIIDDASHASHHQGKPVSLPKTRDFMITFFEGGEYIPNELLSEDFTRSIRDSLACYAWFPAFNGEASSTKIFVLRKAG